MERLFRRDAPPANLVIRGARLFDRGAGLEGTQLDVRIADGRIAEIGDAVDSGGVEEIDATGLTMTPGLVDPHVHLRTPGDEDEEDIASGTRAAAAGGFVAILAMPNTSPVIDSATLLGGLIEQAREQAAVPTGFFAAITRGQDGRELVDMAELAGRGAAGFSDDGRPVERAAMLRRALQYSTITGLKLTLHEEEMTLADGGQMHEGAVSAELGLGGHPGIAESVMVGRDLQIARHEGAPLHLCHISAAESVAEIRRAKELGVEVTAEVSPHHLCLTDEAVRVARPQPPQDEPAAALGRRPGRADRGDGRRHAGLHRHRPRPAPAAGEGAAVRGRAERGDRAGDGVPGGLHTPRGAGAGAALDGGRADDQRPGQRVPPAGAGTAGRRGRQPRPLEPGRELAGGAALRVAIAELLVRRADAARRVHADGGRRRRSPTGWWRRRCERRDARPRGRHGAGGRRLRRHRHGGRRAGVHHLDDRLPGDRHRPVVRRAGDHLHPADDRQLRCRGGRVRVGQAARPGDRRPRGPQRQPQRTRGVLRLARPPRRGRHPGAGHADADPPPARRRHGARGCLQRRHAGRRAAGDRAGGAGDGRPGAGRRRLLHGAGAAGGYGCGAGTRRRARTTG